MVCIQVILSMHRDFHDSVVWTDDTFENNSEINHFWGKYFKESSLLVSDEHFFLKYFLKIDFVRKTIRQFCALNA